MHKHKQLSQKKKTKNKKQKNKKRVPYPACSGVVVSDG